MRSIIAQVLLILVASAQCGVIIILDNDSWQDNLIPQLDEDLPQVEDIPDPKDVAKMARFVVHKANWTSVAYTSHQQDTQGRPLATMWSVSDGPVESGSGVPYFYVSRLQAAVTDLLDSDNRCSLMMSLAESNICKDKGWDPEDPRCAQVTMTGTFHKMMNKSVEYPQAVKAVFSRHPDFLNLPESHHFFLAKFNIDSILVQDTFGGPSKVPVADYFDVHDSTLNLRAVYPKIVPLVDII